MAAFLLVITPALVLVVAQALKLLFEKESPLLGPAGRGDCQGYVPTLE